MVASQLMSFARTKTFDALVRDLATAPVQEGPAAQLSNLVVIGWGRHDRLCLPRAALRSGATSMSLAWSTCAAGVVAYFLTALGTADGKPLFQVETLVNPQLAIRVAVSSILVFGVSALIVSLRKR